MNSRSMVLFLSTEPLFFWVYFLVNLILFLSLFFTQSDANRIASNPDGPLEGAAFLNQFNNVWIPAQGPSFGGPYDHYMAFTQ